MLILYTTVEGGHWIPFNTPMDDPGLVQRINQVTVYHAEAYSPRCRVRNCIDITQYGDHICTRPLPQPIDCDARGNVVIYVKRLFVPCDDSLPEFHSILTRNNWRWDAQNERWFPFNCSSDFHQWWNTYIQNWRPFEDDDEREHVWKDQMHPNEDLREMIERSR